MAKDDAELGARIADRLVAMGPVAARRMFGGTGLFLDGTMFGLVWRGAVYFKVGPANRAQYVAAASEPFAYMRGARRIEMSYATVPDAVLADGAQLADWGERALAVARAKKRRK
jgi:DNA transformation protein and related proteins